VEESRTPGERGGLAAGWQGLIAAFASAALYVAAFPPFNVAETAYVFALPLLLAALFMRPARGMGWSLLAGGWAAWFVLIFWLRNVTGHFEGAGFRALGWLAVLALAGVLAVFWWSWCAAAVWLVRRVRTRALPARIGAMLALAGLWVVMEWIRSWLFTGLPWLPLSASQWQRPLLLQVAALTGAWGVSFVLIAFNLGLAFYLHGLWRNRREPWWKRLSHEFYLALALLFAAIGFGLHASGAGARGRTDGPRIAFVQPNVGAFEKWDAALARDNLDTLRDLTVYAGYLGAELVLWPESPTPMPLKGNDSMRAWVDALARETGIPMLIGNIAIEPGDADGGQRWYNAIFRVDPQGGADTRTYYAKRHLVPFGEYVPLAGWLPFLRKVIPVPGDFSPGDSASPLSLQFGGGADHGRVGNLVCYEDIFPALARENTRMGADWHYVATNNAWFGEEAAAWQHAAHAVLRAVETRRPVVRCGNAGWSGWIDEFGQIRHAMLDERSSVYFQGVEVVPLSFSPWWAGRLSAYVRYGDWFVALCAALVALGCGCARYCGPGAPSSSRRKGAVGELPRLRRPLTGP
jgi:apolipoprotein N-acyltransferase